MKSGWMRLVQAAAVLALVGGLWAQGAGAAEVKNVKAAFLWPWTNGVGIEWEVTGGVATNSWLVVTATDRAHNAAYTGLSNALEETPAGTNYVFWDLAKQGIQIQSTNVVFKVEYVPDSYCVVDLSGGTNATSYSVTYLDAPPSGGFNTDEYKTTKLVLRRIPKGTFTMGTPSSESVYIDESQHTVTLTKAFYIGLFEVTQKQYALVMGSNPSRFSGDKRPVEQVSWNVIRGNSDTYNWPNSTKVDANSFIGRLQKRTGLAFDLPTEAQWEYACRAGTTTAYSYGGSANGDYMWYRENSSLQTHDVGTKKANPWGLYDMHGNVAEWCLDRYESNLGTAAVTDPKGASSGSRVFRTGSWGAYAVGCCSARRCGDLPPSGTSDILGFRLSRTLSAE